MVAFLQQHLCHQHKHNTIAVVAVSRAMRDQWVQGTWLAGQFTCTCMQVGGCGLEGDAYLFSESFQAR